MEWVDAYFFHPFQLKVVSLQIWIDKKTVGVAYVKYTK